MSLETTQALVAGSTQTQRDGSLRVEFRLWDVFGEAQLTGRYVPSESPQQSDFEAGERTGIAVADLINPRQRADLVYAGYLTLRDAPAGVETIAAPPPELDAELNLLNLFYALEWVIFGGFAVYLWWRLVKDEWEKEQELQRQPAAEEALDARP